MNRVEYVHNGVVYSIDIEHDHIADIIFTALRDDDAPLYPVLKKLVTVKS